MTTETTEIDAAPPGAGQHAADAGPPARSNLPLLLVVALVAGLFGYVGGAMTTGSEATAATSAGAGVDAPVLGSPDAPITLEIYSDFGCPFCQRHDQETEPELIARYVDTGQVRLEWHDFPAQGDASMRMAVAGRAAARQGMFWEYQDALFATEGGASSGAALTALAGDVGLDTAQFEVDLADPALELAVRRDFEHGQRLGVRGTPTFVVGDNGFSGAQPLSVFEEFLAEAASGDAGDGAATGTDAEEGTAGDAPAADADTDAVGAAATSSTGEHLRTPEQVAALLAAPPEGLTVLDVRTPGEFAEGHLDGAVNINVEGPDFVERVGAELDPTQPVLVYCRSGNRSAVAVAQLRELGFSDIRELDGGVVNWTAAGYPMTTS